MATQKFMGANSLVDRLSAQVGSRDLAIDLLRKRGQMEQGSEKLTPAGEKRNRMTAQERAIDRATKSSGKAASAYTYNPNTNRATLKRTRTK
jgi:hypothetical protein